MNQKQLCNVLLLASRNFFSLLTALLTIAKKDKVGFAILSMGDQLVFSAANFILALTLAKHFNYIDVSGFGVGLSIALIIQGLQRNCYIIQNAVINQNIYKKRATKILGQHLLLMSFIIVNELLLSIFILIFYNDPYYMAVLFSTIVYSLIYAQIDFDRMVMLKHNKILSSFIASLIFFTLNVFLFYTIPVFEFGFFTTLEIILSFAVLKLFYLITIIGKPDFFWGWRLIKRDFKKNLGGSFVGSLSFAGYNAVPLFILSNTGSVILSAAFVATRSLMQPLQILLRSLDSIDKNIFQAGLPNTNSNIRKALKRQLCVYGSIGLSSVIVCTFFGKQILILSYGDKYTEFEQILFIWSLITLILAITFPLETVIIKIKKLNTYNTLRLSAGFTGTFLGLLLCPVYGVTGAITASLIGWILSLFCALWVTRKILIHK